MNKKLLLLSYSALMFSIHSPAIEMALEEGDVEESTTRKKRSSWTQTTKIWENNIVYYSLAKATPQMRKAFMQAKNNIEKISAVRFIERGQRKEGFIDVIHVKGRYHCRISTLGKASPSRELKLTEDCNQNDILAGLVHALGFHHEHRRKDRDQYVTIQQTGPDFDIDERINITRPYDFDSITHAAKATLNTSTPSQRNTGRWIGQLSPADVSAIRDYYQGAVGEKPAAEPIVAKQETMEGGKITYHGRVHPFSEPPQIDIYPGAQTILFFKHPQLKYFTAVNQADLRSIAFFTRNMGGLIFIVPPDTPSGMRYFTVVLTHGEDSDQPKVYEIQLPLNILPAKPGTLSAFSLIRSRIDEQCLTVLKSKPYSWFWRGQGYSVGTAPCEANNRAQKWAFNRQLKLINQDHPGYCLGTGNPNRTIRNEEEFGFALIESCKLKPSQIWRRIGQKELIYNGASFKGQEHSLALFNNQGSVQTHWAQKDDLQYQWDIVPIDVD